MTQKTQIALKRADDATHDATLNADTSVPIKDTRRTHILIVVTGKRKLSLKWSILHGKIDMIYMQTAKTMSWNESDISSELIQMITFDHAF